MPLSPEQHLNNISNSLVKYKNAMTNMHAKIRHSQTAGAAAEAVDLVIAMLEGVKQQCYNLKLDLDTHFNAHPHKDFLSSYKEDFLSSYNETNKALEAMGEHIKLIRTTVNDWQPNRVNNCGQGHDLGSDSATTMENLLKHEHEILSPRLVVPCIEGLSSSYQKCSSYQEFRINSRATATNQHRSSTAMFQPRGIEQRGQRRDVLTLRGSL